MSALRATARLDGAEWGLLIDRGKPLRFTFDGSPYSGYAGDVIASALYAQGRRLISRSFKYHRPRGVLTMAGHDANAMVQVGAEPNVRADRHDVSEGLAATSINRLGPLDHDLLAGLGLFSPLLPVGFYYKTFFRPRGAWQHLFEPVIRQLAGLGRLDPKAEHGTYDKAYLFTDVLVVGGGPAGLEAAIAAAEAGAETLLIDEWPELGGSLLFARGKDRTTTDERRRELVARAKATPKLTILTSTTVSGLFSDNWSAAISGTRLYKIRARETVIAAGAFDQALVFPDNDRPGIMFVDAAQRLMRLYGVKPGKRAVIATANRFGYEAALDLLDAGVEVAAVVDLNPEAAGPAAEEARFRGVRIIPSSTLAGTRGVKHVEAVAVAGIKREGRAHAEAEWIDCDLVLMSVGYSPALNLACHAGARALYDPAINMHRAANLPPGVTLAGSAHCVWSDDTVAEDGRRAGRSAAARALGLAAPTEGDLETDAGALDVTHPFPIFPRGKGKDFLDFDEDLVSDDIINSIADGYDDIQLVKRYSTEGLGPSQGRHANLNTIRIVARETGKTAGAVGTTTFRPPLMPEKFGQLAGRAFEPKRLTPMHARHVAAGARLMVAGTWMRPAYYGEKSRSAEAIRAEVNAVRNAVGMIDVSTLGGLDIRGPDAAELVDRMYTWAYAKQPVGRARYALMCDETGVIIDDGVACRLHDRHFYLTATTGAVDQVYRQMSWLNAQWKLDVDIANVTAAYAGVNLAGPLAREVIVKLKGDIDFKAESFPYMGVRVGRLDGIPVRVLRVGFVGELGYEIHCPAQMGEALWDMLMEAGAAAGIMPFGVEAQRVLRLEKAHIIVGQDTDGLTHPAEAGMEWALAKKKPFYIGKRSIEMQMAKGVARKLVGFTIADPEAPTPKECHLVIRDGDIAGRVTSAVRSPSLGTIIGLAYVPADLAETGSHFDIRVDAGRMLTAEVVPTPFYDPLNSRQEM